MTAPRPHAEPAARYFSDDTMKCWARFKKDGGDWFLLKEPSFSSSILEYHVGHEPPPPAKRTITLTVNGREWVLPEPMTDDAPRRFYYISESNSVQPGLKGVAYYEHLRTHIKLNGGGIYATEADAQAWADFDKWCRGGGHG